MSLQFILGNSGSGKTENSYKQLVSEAFRHPYKNYLVIVPEQFTLATQKKLVELSPNGAIMNIDVLSFKRLAYRVFDEIGKNHLNVLEETGKNLLLRKLAEDQKENLTVMLPNLNRMGYISQLKSFLSELTQYRIGPDQLEAYAGETSLSPAFSAKLNDVVTMYRAFRESLTDGMITAEEILEVLIASAEESDLLKGSVILLDDFTGFTPIQNELIRKLLPIADRMMIILTSDSKDDLQREVEEHELFSLTHRQIIHLTQMAEEVKVAVLPPVIYGDSAGKRFRGRPGLAALEEKLFRPGQKPMEENAEEIRICSCNNPREELLFAAREISRLVREKGLRYKDFAIVTGDVNTYGAYAEDIFGRYEIPFFLDSATEIVFHPFIESIRAILELVEDDFSYESVMRFLKSGFSSLEDFSIDLLDNYLLATRIRGAKAWSARWLRLPSEMKEMDLELLNQMREEICACFLPLFEIFHPGREKGLPLVKDAIYGLYDLMVRLDCEKTLGEMEERYTAEGDPVKAKEYGQIYRIVMDLLDKFYGLLGNERMSISEFSDVLDAGLSAASLASLPLAYDTVTLGDIERTRLNQIHYMFFLGVNDGIIPAVGNSGGIISEFEREEMIRNSGLVLAPGTREQAFIQRFYLYRMLTKADTGLYITFSRADLEGKAIRPSYLIGILRKIFPKLSVEVLDPLAKTQNLSTPAAAMDYLIHGEMDAAWYALAACFMEREPEKTEQLLEARYAKYENHPLSRVIAEALYGHSLEGSVTRLERFAACAYAHFLQYGLKLKERRTGEFENVDMGNIYHKALERYSLHLRDSAYDWFTLPSDLREEYANEAMEEALLEYQDIALYQTAADLHMAMRMREIFRQTVWALSEQVKAGQFVPTEFELSFSHMEENRQLQIALDRDHVMNLHGVIDRLDLLEEDHSVYIKVIDYKSGGQDFDLIQIYEGLNLQLILYLNTSWDYIRAKEKGKVVHPGALFYYHIQDPVIEDSGSLPLSEEEIKAELLKALKPTGLVNGDPEVLSQLDRNLAPSVTSEVIPVGLKKDGSPTAASKIASEEDFETISSYVLNKIRESGSRIYRGDISVNPYKTPKKDSCSWCPYAGICQINSKLDGFISRRFPQMKESDVIPAMEEENSITGVSNGS